MLGRAVSRSWNNEKKRHVWRIQGSWLGWKGRTWLHLPPLCPGKRGLPRWALQRRCWRPCQGLRRDAWLPCSTILIWCPAASFGSLPTVCAWVPVEQTHFFSSLLGIPGIQVQPWKIEEILAWAFILLRKLWSLCLGDSRLRSPVVTARTGVGQVSSLGESLN